MWWMFEVKPKLKIFSSFFLSYSTAVIQEANHFGDARTLQRPHGKTPGKPLRFQGSGGTISSKRWKQTRMWLTLPRGPHNISSVVSRWNPLSNLKMLWVSGDGNVEGFRQLLAQSQSNPNLFIYLSSMFHCDVYTFWGGTGKRKKSESIYGIYQKALYNLLRQSDSNPDDFDLLHLRVLNTTSRKQWAIKQKLILR